MQAAQRQSLLYNNNSPQGYSNMANNKKQSYSVNQSIENSYLGINPQDQKQMHHGNEVSPQNYKRGDEDKINRRGILIKKPYGENRANDRNQSSLRQGGSQDVQGNYR